MKSPLQNRSSNKIREAASEDVAIRHVEFLYRLLVAAVPMSLFGVLTGLFVLGHRSLYLAILLHFGLKPFDFPFLDLHATLAAAECHRLGVDVYLSNPCDVLGRVQAYSPLLLDLVPQALGRDSLNLIGMTLDLVFILSLPLIIRPRSIGQCLLMIGAAVSPTVIYALERADNDVIIFLLMVCAGVLFAGTWLPRLVAYLIFLFGGLLKFYPLALLVLTLRENGRRASVLIALSCIAVLGLWLIHGRELTLVLGNLAETFYYSDSIAARNLPFGLAQLFSRVPIGPADPLAIAMLVILAAGSMILALKMFHALEQNHRALEMASREVVYLLVGAILLVGCFFSYENVSYRGIFLLLVIPGLLRFRHDAESARVRRLIGLALVVVLCLLWEQRLALGLDHVVATSIISSERNWAWGVVVIYWVCKELSWWALMSLFIALIVALLSRMPLAADLASVARRRTSPRAIGARSRPGD